MKGIEVAGSGLQAGDTSVHPWRRLQFSGHTLRNRQNIQWYSTLRAKNIEGLPDIVRVDMITRRTRSWHVAFR
jgi:hypothetical protein